MYVFELVEVTQGRKDDAIKNTTPSLPQCIAYKIFLKSKLYEV
jgi:hypothetical protein